MGRSSCRKLDLQCGNPSGVDALRLTLETREQMRSYLWKRYT